MPHLRRLVALFMLCALWAALTASPALAANATAQTDAAATAASGASAASAANASAPEAGAAVRQAVNATAPGAAGALAGALGDGPGPLDDEARESVKTLPQAGDMTGALFQVAGVLCLLLALMFLGFWVLKRFGKRMGLGVFGSGDLRIEGTMSLGPKKSIVVVRFLNKRMVLGVTDASINLLTQVDTGHDTDRKDFDKALDEARAKDGGM
ncbi:flagellar biosynthetic protein FliO [Desulfocurvus vexinensis]|uniref:flagellar biosynthetic protein FliO n=1 Tax=Desulfocurvus vexinensis TaxID=399548 RepID=UPI0004B168A8|nr:flagellar biosynthetic protein FliO [Desulfocurvus vexinensis]